MSGLLRKLTEISQVTNETHVDTLLSQGVCVCRICISYQFKIKMDKILSNQRKKRKRSTHLSLYKTKYFNLKKKHRLMSSFTKAIESVPLENNSP